MQLKDIQELLKFVNKSDLSEVRIEKDNFKLNIKTKHYHTGSAAPMVAAPVAAPQPVQATAPAAAPEKAKGDKQDEAPAGNETAIKAPMIGTFYRKPAPDKDEFVKVGDTVNKGDVVCVIEAMKLFNEIESDVSGKIVKILVDDASPVEYDQPLFLVE